MGTTSVVVLTSAARTTNTTSVDFALNHAGRGRFTIDITAVPGGASTDTVTFSVQGKDAASGKYATLLSTAAVSAVSTVMLEMGQGVADSANAAANKMLPACFRLLVTHSGAGSFTYSVGADVLT